MGFSYFQSYKIRATAYVWVVNQWYELEIISGNFTYSINSIPNGSIRVAVGRNAIYGNASFIHSLAPFLRSTTPVEVYLDVRPGGSSFGFPIDPWPIGPFRVFSGYIANVSDSLDQEDASCVINLVGWPVVLSYGSILSTRTHTLTPQMLNNAATFATGTGIAWSMETIAHEFFTRDKIQSDFWGNSLRPWLMKIASQDMLTEPGDPVGFFRQNLMTLSALQRFEPFFDPQTQSLYYNFGVPLRIQQTNQQDSIVEGLDFIAAGISAEMAKNTISAAEAGTVSLWDKLVGNILPDYRLAVVPLASSALVVPVCPGFQTPWQTIWGQEYTEIEVTDQKPRQLKGIRLFLSSATFTGVGNGGRLGESNDMPTTGGRFDEPNVGDDGIILYMNAPSWTSNCIAPSIWGRKSTAPFSTKANVVFPNVTIDKEEPVPQNKEGENPKNAKIKVKNVWDLVAHAMYVGENLRGRNASITGRLRFDIAPGSTVAIQTVRDKFVNRQVPLGGQEFLFGEVITVTFSFNSESMSAGTAFAISNVRNWYENVYPGTSVERHPFYAVPWNGAPLVERAEFIPHNSYASRILFPNLW